MRKSARRTLVTVTTAVLLAGGFLLVRSSRDVPAGLGIDVRDEIDDPAWTLFAIEYARSDGVALDRLVEGADPTATVDMSWYFWLAVGHGRALLVDTGTDLLARQPEGRAARRWSIAQSRTVPEALASVGLEPDGITDVVITHGHWDHVGALVRFERARIHVHSEVWAEMFLPMDNVETFATTPVSPVPELTVLEFGGHTEHHCVVELVCGGVPHVIAGDSAYLFHNLEASVPITVTRSPEADVEDLQALVERVGEGHVLPGHDPEIFERFPSPLEGVARICP